MLGTHRSRGALAGVRDLEGIEDEAAGGGIAVALLEVAVGSSQARLGADVAGSGLGSSSGKALGGPRANLVRLVDLW